MSGFTVTSALPGRSSVLRHSATRSSGRCSSARVLGSVEILNKHEIACELVELTKNNRTSVRTETHAKRSDPGGVRHHLYDRITTRAEVAEPNPRPRRRFIYVVDSVRANGPVSPEPRRRSVEDLFFNVTT